MIMLYLLIVKCIYAFDQSDHKPPGKLVNYVAINYSIRPAKFGDLAWVLPVLTKVIGGPPLIQLQSSYHVEQP